MNIALANKHFGNVDEPRTDAEDAAESYFATALKPLDPELYSMDPAERLEFSRAPSENITRFDNRSDHELKVVMFDHEDPVERERAAWEYGNRHKAEAVSTVVEVAKGDADRAVRWGTLWLLQKIGADRTADVLSQFVRDGDVEVRDWAHLLLREITGVEQPNRVIRPARIDESNPFDQTLPLVIAGYARTHLPGMGWVQSTLSPLWFEAILGRVMACTCVDTFDTTLVIEKRMKAYHSDGSDHYEIYRFGGNTFHPAVGVTHHIYECTSTHTFYPSGKVEDTSVPPIGDVNVILNRVATPIRVPVRFIPERFPIERVSPLPRRTLSPLPRRILSPASVPRSDAGAPPHIVESVRGRYMGSAFINLERLMANNMKLGAGEVQLSNWHHPVVGTITNTFLFGSFKGKLSALNDDGYVDINTELCHGTKHGELDFNLHDNPNSDPYDPLQKV